jgi:hypothetical protein
LHGTSRSRRFGTLLCYHSVVWIVTPQNVDSFFVDLQPCQHYGPPNADGSDFVSHANRCVSHPNQSARIKQIITNAIQWCREEMTYSAISTKYLDLGDPQWMIDTRSLIESHEQKKAVDMQKKTRELI